MSDSRVGAIPIPRRDFFALGGAGIAVGALAGCGSNAEEPTESRDIELLTAALVGEENSATALQTAEAEVKGDELELVKALNAAASKRAAELQDLIAQLRDTPPEGDFGVEGSGRDAALGAAVDGTNAAIAAYRLGAGQFSTEELRSDAITAMGPAAIRLSLLNGLLGEEISPEAFVTGSSEKPFSSSDPDDGDDEDEDDDSDSETTSTSSTTESTTGDAETSTTSTTEAEE